MEKFRKRHDFLVCVDSDGCAVNNLAAKHRRCFGPCLVREWQLEKWRDEVLAIWERINLYGLTRGIHRFRALALALEEVDRRLAPVTDLGVLTEWVENTESFSDDALRAAVARQSSPVLEKALRWSEAVNAAVAALSWDEKRFFAGVEDSLKFARQHADIAVLSSAGEEAVLSEWTHAAMAGNVDVFLCREGGSKAQYIARLRQEGYADSRILMVGDAPSDRASAELSGVAFYPVLAGREEESWQGFPRAAQLFFDGAYPPLERKLAEEFMMNLAGGQSDD
jgi:phosphoglycolate phosphatase-like HAD superfamily hydrolase